MMIGTLEHQQSSIPVKDILSFNEQQQQTARLYPLSNYTFGTKETQPEEDPSVKDRLRRLEEHYDKYGMRRTCEGILRLRVKHIVVLHSVNRRSWT